MAVPLVLAFAIAATGLVVLVASRASTSGRQGMFRFLSLVIDGGLLAVSGAVAIELADGGAPSYAYLLVGALAAGSSLHAVGVASWDGRPGWWARAIGLGLLAVPLLVPGPLTLALPAAAVLLFTLRANNDPGFDRGELREAAGA